MSWFGSKSIGSFIMQIFEILFQEKEKKVEYLFGP